LTWNVELGAVTVSAPARLHWGLINESGTGGRVDGGVGLALSSPSWTVHMGSNLRSRLSGEHNEVAERVVARLSREWGTEPCGVLFGSVIPFHVGLGAKTSLTLAVARGYAELRGVPVRTADIAALLGRGGTSGVGVHVSDGGGLVVEYGHRFPEDKQTFGPSSSRLATGVPDLAHRFRWPDSWKVILVQLGGKGLSGAAERAFFNANCPVPAQDTAEILHLVKTTLLPSIERRYLPGVQDYLRATQRLGLKVREWTTQSSDVTKLRHQWACIESECRLISPLCLSSLGPQLFMVSDNPTVELGCLRRLRLPPGSFTVGEATNNGVLVRSTPQ